MILFTSDYCEGCHEKILEELVRTNLEQTPGYGTDEYCRDAADRIRAACGNRTLDVHFLVGGTQTNATVIDGALRPHQGVIAADSGHINVHETGAIEAAGHKVLALPSKNGKISGEQVDRLIRLHREEDGPEHTVQPGMVYISNPTELGTIYSKRELTELSEVCRSHGLYLFLDGARLGYGLVSPGNDLTLADIARLCDVFYIGGTKVGALFGEAVVISNPSLKPDFRYLIKQHGAMLAKGRLLGIQFRTLFTDELYFKIASHGVCLAGQIRECLMRCGFDFLVDSPSNQLFPILPNSFLERLKERYGYTVQGAVDAEHTAIRLCTSWATRQEDVTALCRDLWAWAGRGGEYIG